MIPGNASPLLLATAADAAAAAAGPTRSLRFNSGDSATLTKTFSSAGNRKTWTWAGWVKKCVFTTSQAVFSATGFGTGLYINDTNLNGEIVVDFSTGSDNSTRTLRYTSRIFRDPSAWYHIVYAVDTTQATGSDRLKLYVNGEQQDLDNIVNGTWPTQNSEGHINNAVAHGIGYRINTSDYYFNGYLADVYFIDGSQLDPTSFGAFDDNGVWQAAAYSGTYGTNGFHLQFNDASSDSALGTDSSGNSNTWTVNNITAKSPGDYDSPKHFDVVTYTGDGSSSRSITALNFSPDFLWLKRRNTAAAHTLYDSVRGLGATKELSSSDTAAEGTSVEADNYGYVSSLDANGFTVNQGAVNASYTNANNDTYVAWAWNASDNSNKTYTVKVVSDSGNKYRFDDFGTSAVTLDLAEGSTYVFDQSDSSNSGHPLRFSTTSDGTHNSGTEYTTGVTTTGTPGSAGAKTTIVVAASAPTLYYYCSSHSGMGGQANTNDTEGASNFDGTIQAKVKTNQDYGFSIVSYNAGLTSSGSKSIGHGLTTAPKIIIAKDRDDGTHAWRIRPFFLNDNAYDYLEFDTGALAQLSSGDGTMSLPTSTTFDVNWNASVGASGNIIAYCWSEISGFSKFGTYSGGTNPNTIVTGFKPRFVLIKRTDSTASHYVWMMYDSVRGGTKKLAANYSSVENESSNIGDDASNVIEFVSNGFKHTKTNAATNASGGTYIYMAFAGTPAGEEDDSLFDVPTNGTQSDTGAGGEVSGNYAVMNALVKGSGTTLDNGNLDVAATGSAWNSVFGTIFVSSGKYYAEVAAIDVDSDYSTKRVGVGFARSTTNLSSTASSYLGADALSGAYFSNGNAFTNNTNNNVNSSFQTGDVIGVALDMDAGTVTFYKNGVAESGTFTGLSGANCIAVSVHGSGGKASINFGQRPWAFSPPSNHVAMNTAALPTPTIADGSDYFDTKLWTGNASTDRDITGLGFSPDLTWIKIRNGVYGHFWFDTIRGATKDINSEANYAESTVATSLQSFGSDGFNIGNSVYVNQNGETYVAWNWDAGSSTASNTDGSITSNVRANSSAGFSIVTYTGTGTAPSTVGHGLNAAPSLIFFKRRDATSNWITYNSSLGATKYIVLNNTNAAATDSGPFNNTAATSSVFTVNTFGDLNASGGTYVAYCFAPVAGYSAFDSYTGNGSSDGPFVHTGFRPALIIFRNTGGPHIWGIYDSARNTYNVADKFLRANGGDVEGTAVGVDFLSNGFKIRGSQGFYNQSGATILYMAWAENPFQANGGLAR